MNSSMETPLSTKLKDLVSNYVGENVEKLRELRHETSAIIRELEDLRDRIDAGLMVFSRDYIKQRK